MALPFRFFEHLTTAIALLFFMHGAKLSREADYRRRQLLAFASVGDVQHTFILFPVLGVLFAW
ncbi:bile acid:sodium symporter [Klebsiella variicola subsp. variicola]|nr:bile acid:sodium symporter [Klebsiella variicola subsp. variicola]